MAKTQYKKRSPRSRSRRYLKAEESKAQIAALILLLLLPLDILFPMRIWRYTNPQTWEQTQVIYQDHVRRSDKGGYFYVMHDADGNAWRLPDPDQMEMERFAEETEQGDRLVIRYYPWFVGNIVKSIEGYRDFETAAGESREIARKDGYAFAFFLTVSLLLIGYILYQLNKVHRFLPRRGRS